jgi:hypothetical protein
LSSRDKGKRIVLNSNNSRNSTMTMVPEVSTKAGNGEAIIDPKRMQGHRGKGGRAEDKISSHEDPKDSLNYFGSNSNNNPKTMVPVLTAPVVDGAKGSSATMPSMAMAPAPTRWP